MIERNEFRQTFACQPLQPIQREKDDLNMFLGTRIAAGAVPGVRAIRRHQREIKFAERLHVAADVTDTACVARQREFKLRVVVPEEWTALALMADVVPVVAVGTADDFANQHGGR